MIRRLFAGLSVVSLLLFVAAVLVWIRAKAGHSTALLLVQWNHGNSFYGVTVASDGLTWHVNAGEWREGNTHPFWPIPFLLLVLGAIPWLRRCDAAIARRMALWRARRAASRAGLCRTCGYDLRASVDRCPECGKPIQSKERTPA